MGVRERLQPVGLDRGGQRLVDDGGAQAFYWQSGLGIRSLTDYGTCGYRAALGINDVGQIVGAGCTAGGRQHAMLWT